MQMKLAAPSALADSDSETQEFYWGEMDESTNAAFDPLTMEVLAPYLHTIDDEDLVLSSLEDRECSSSDDQRLSLHSQSARSPTAMEDIFSPGTEKRHCSQESAGRPAMFCFSSSKSESTCEYYDLEEARKELQKYVDSATDPVGKFMKRWHLSPADACRLNIHCMLLEAPRKPREKYGKRREISDSDRVFACRARNRQHARATRVRKRIFREIESILTRERTLRSRGRQ